MFRYRVELLNEMREGKKQAKKRIRKVSLHRLNLIKIIYKTREFLHTLQIQPVRIGKSKQNQVL